MKNVFKTTLYIISFALAGVLFQISCSNSDETTLAEPEDKFVFVKKDFITGGIQSIWIANYDGTSQTQIPISLPTGYSLYSVYSSGEHSTAKLMRDGNLVVFTVEKNATHETYIYSCNIDGSNLQQIAAFDANMGIFL